MDEPTFSEVGDIRYLHFGTEWVQGAMSRRHPTKLVLEYTRQMLAWLLWRDMPPRVGVLGLGAGSLVRWLIANTRCVVDAVEWNPKVVSAAQAWFRLPPAGPRLAIHLADAADWVAQTANRAQPPGALMIDLYDAQARGPVRDSEGFYRDCRDLLAQADGPGVLTVNLFGEHPSYRRNIDNLLSAFDGQVCVLPAIDAGNTIALACTRSLSSDKAALTARAGEVQAQWQLPARRWASSLTPVVKFAGPVGLLPSTGLR
jgi:spermidine synthase